MKKKLLAVILAVVMVVSALAVLGACTDNEFTVSFGNPDGREYFSLKTKGGKLSQADVEAETAKISNGDMTFMGWFATLEYDNATDETKFLDPIDYDTVYEEDTDYYAYWFGGSGSDNGYTVVGVINGDTCWDAIPEDHDAWVLEQDSSSIWLYSVTITVLGGDAFKVKEIAAGWDPAFGYESLAEVLLADNATVEFPDGVTKDDLFYSSGNDKNIGVSLRVEEMEITIVYDHSIGMLRIIINSATILEGEPELTYILVGGFGGDDNWNYATTNTDLHFSPVAGQEGKYEITVDLEQGLEWVVSAIPGGYNTLEVGAGILRNVTKGAEVGEDVDVNTVIKKAGTGIKDHISAARPCNVTITYDAVANAIDVLINSVEEGQELTWFLVGSFDGNSWNADEALEGYILKAVAGQDGKYQITIDLAADVQWQVVAIPGGWSNQRGAGTIAEITKAESVDVDDLDAMFTGDRSNPKDNIVTTRACNVTITLDTTTGQISIHVNSLLDA